MNRSVRGRRAGGRRFPVATALSLVMVASAVAALPATAAGAVAAAAPACPSSVADAAGAAAAAKACGGRVEVMSGRSETGQVFANADGTSTMETSITPRWVRRGNGTWADIDTRLVSAGGGIRPAASAVDVTFSAGGKGPAVTLVQDGKKVSLSWGGGRLPAPAINGSTATYAGVLPDGHLALTATGTGFQHVLVVKNAAAAANPALKRVVFKVSGDAKAKAGADGHVRFADPKGLALASTAAASTWDSHVDIAAAGEVLPGV